jgi:hypothetical protein
MKRIRIFLPLLVIVCLACMPAWAASKNKPGTRDLVFEEEELKKVAEPEEKLDEATVKGGTKISISTSLELQRDGKTNLVPPNSTFKTGDRVRIIYTPGMDGHIYWLAKMTSGKYTVLFPSKKTGMDNMVKKNQEYALPPKGRFRFDDNTGKEELTCVISPTPVKALDDAIKAAGEFRTVDLNKLTEVVEQLGQENLNKRKTRDLVFEEDENETTLVKTQTLQPGDPFVATFELIHEPADEPASAKDMFDVSKVKGLWLEMSAFPADAQEVEATDVSADGLAYKRSLLDGAITLEISRFTLAGKDKSYASLKNKDVLPFVKAQLDAEGIRTNNLKLIDQAEVAKSGLPQENDPRVTLLLNAAPKMQDMNIFYFDGPNILRLQLRVTLSDNTEADFSKQYGDSMDGAMYNWLKSIALVKK